MIGKKIREVRLCKGVSLRKLAAASGLSHSFISDIEHGRCDPSISSLRSLANALGVRVAVFLETQE